MMFIKLSIGVFLLRLAVQTAYIWILRVSLVIIAIWSTVIFFWNIFQCDPVDKQWDYRIKGGRCVDPDQLVSAAYAMTALTVLSDWLYVRLRRRGDILHVLTVCFLGASSHPHGLECQNVKAGQGDRNCHSRPGNIVSRSTLGRYACGSRFTAQASQPLFGSVSSLTWRTRRTSYVNLAIPLNLQ